MGALNRIGKALRRILRRPSAPVPPPPAAKRRDPSTPHANSREIERRLRQQARAANKEK